MDSSNVDVSKLYQQKTALIIDNSDELLNQLKKTLRAFGVQFIETATNGNQAIRLCENNTYDIIFADYNLGDSSNGQQILEELRYKNSVNNHTIYVIITEDTTKNAVLGVLEYQPDDYLTKPVDQTALKKRLDRLLIEKNHLKEINTALANGDQKNVIRLCNEHIALDDPYQLRYYEILGDCLLGLGAYEKAKNVYEKVLTIRDVDWASVGLAKSLTGLNQLDDAKKVLQQLVNNDTTNMEAYDCLSTLHLKALDTEEAQQILHKAIDMSPNSLRRQQAFADTCKTNQDWALAVSSYENCIQLAKNSMHANPEFHFQLARCIKEEMLDTNSDIENRLEAALDTLNAASAEYSQHNNVALHADIIETTVTATSGTKDNFDDVIPDIEARLNSASDVSPQLLLDLAETYQSVGKRNKAQQVLKDMMATYASDEEICRLIDNLSDVPLSSLGKQNIIELNRQGKDLFASKKYIEAIRLFDKALEVHPNNIGLNLNLMLALVSEMTVSETSPEHIERCKIAKGKLAHLSDSHPLFERYQTLCKHLQQLENSKL